jgi:hypothetical protein
MITRRKFYALFAGVLAFGKTGPVVAEMPKPKKLSNEETEQILRESMREQLSSLKKLTDEWVERKRTDRCVCQFPPSRHPHRVTSER